MGMQETLFAGALTVFSGSQLVGYIVGPEKAPSVPKTETAIVHETEQATPELPVLVAKPVDEYQVAYMKECVRYGFSHKQCDNIWNDRYPDMTTEGRPEALVITKSATHVAEVEVTPGKLQVDNPEYVQRREAALRKPDAVIMHMTVR